MQRSSALLGAMNEGQVIAAGLALTAAAVLALAIAQAIDFGVFNLRLRILDSNHHASVFGAVSLLAQASVAALALMRAGRSPRRGAAWLTLGCLLGVLLVVRSFTAYSATTVGPPLVLVFALISWLTLGDDVTARAVVWASLALLACSFLLHSVGLDADGTHGRGNQTWAYQLTGIVKHGAELSGWMLLGIGLAAGVAAGGATAGSTPRRAATRLRTLRIFSKTWSGG